MEKGKISIVLPLYNMEKYITRCVQSVMDQTYSDFELIVVDDGSTDGGDAVVQEFAKNDSRIKMIRLNHAGVSHARNTALKEMSGEFVAFIDADDYLHPSYLEDLYRIASDNEADIAICRGYMFHEEGKTSDFPECSGKIEMLDSNEAIFACLGKHPDLPYLHSALWNKIYRVSKLTDTDLFDEKFEYGEDTKWLLPVMIRCEKIVWIDVFRYYHQISASVKQYNTANNYLNFYSWQESFLRENNVKSKYTEYTAEVENKCLTHIYISNYCVNGQINKTSKMLRSQMDYLRKNWTRTRLGTLKLCLCIILVRHHLPTSVVEHFYRMKR